MAKGDSKVSGFFGFIVVMLLFAMVYYSLVGVFEDKYESATAFEVFILESSFATTSGFVAPLNAYFRNSDDGDLYERGYERDMDRYGEVYQEGLDEHPLALVLGDVFGSIFSILSAIAFTFAVNSTQSMGAFKAMFWTEIVEESLYYMNVYRMTGEVDVTIIDIGVSLFIAVIVASIAEFARKKRKGA